MRGFYEFLSHSSLPTVDCSSHMTKLTSMETKTMHCLGHSEQQQTQICVIDNFHLLKKCILLCIALLIFIAVCNLIFWQVNLKTVVVWELFAWTSLFVSNCLFLLFPLFALPLSACSSSIYKLGSYDRTQVLLKPPQNGLILPQELYLLNDHLKHGNWVCLLSQIKMASCPSKTWVMYFSGVLWNKTISQRKRETCSDVFCVVAS